VKVLHSQALLVLHIQALRALHIQAPLVHHNLELLAELLPQLDR
jgi:hypothetical protein